MLIAIEGIDGSGKGTQTNLLKERLTKDGFNVRVFSFPQYEENFFGKEVGKYLDGSYGDLDAVNPKFSSLLYALDRFESSTKIKAALDANEIVICDRYVGSNIAHQCARVPEEERAGMEAWIRQVELEILKAVSPDIVIFLDMHVGDSADLVAKKAKRSYTARIQDLHEASPRHLSTAHQNFRRLAARENWLIVNCNDSDGTIRSTASISDEIYAHLQASNG